MPQHGEGTATRPHHECLPTDICTDVARARVSVPGDVNKRLRVFTEVKGVEFCEVKVLSPQAQAEKHGWEVTAMFPMEVRLDTKRGDRVLRTLAFFKTFIPYPCDEEQDGSDLRKLKMRVQIGDIVCSVDIGHEEHCVVIQAAFTIIVYALQDEVITVCRLPGPK